MRWYFIFALFPKVNVQIFSYLFVCGLYLINTLGAWNGHGQAGELEGKLPKQQHIGRKVGRPLSLLSKYMSCWGVSLVSTEKGKMWGCL